MTSDRARLMTFQRDLWPLLCHFTLAWPLTQDFQHDGFDLTLNFDLSLSEVNGYVDHVDDVTGDVRDKPARAAAALELWERFAGDTRPQIVQHLHTCK